MGITRRSFLKTSAASAAASLAAGPVSQVMGQGSTLKPGPGNKWPGRVVINYNKNVVTTSAGGNPTVDPAAAKKMIDDSVLLLTGKTDLAEAWKAVFPSTLSASSTIAIKVPLGCANQTMAPHWTTVKAIVDGITAMDFGGSKLPAGNITIYDMRCSDNLSRYGYTSTNFPGVKLVRDSNTSGQSDGARNKQYAKALQSDFLINVFRPGGHSGYVEGFTLGFKNHYGTYDVDHNSGTAPGYLRDINCTGVVYKKNVLSVCIGIFGAKEASGSPGSDAVSYTTYVKTIDPSASGSLPAATIIMSTDPVTAEMQTIKMMRLNNGKPYGPTDMPKYLKASGGVAGSLSDTVINAGVIDEDEMEILRIVNEKVITTAAGSLHPHGAKKFSQSGIRVAHLAGQGTAFIEFSLPAASKGKNAVIDIFDMKGTLVHSLKRQVAGTVNQVAWNEKTTKGRRVPSGVYMIRVTAGSVQVSDKLTVST